MINDFTDQMILVASTHNFNQSIEFEYNVSCEHNNDSSNETSNTTNENADTGSNPPKSNADQRIDDLNGYWDQGNTVF